MFDKLKVIEYTPKQHSRGISRVLIEHKNIFGKRVQQTYIKESCWKKRVSFFNYESISGTLDTKIEKLVQQHLDSKCV
ncbi:MAG: hypothetical protein ACRC3J_01850 [Culicoidibacterales bacterium]